MKATGERSSNLALYEVAGYHYPMASLTETIRQAVTDSGISRYRIAHETGLPESSLSRFMNGKGAYSGTLEGIIDHLGLEVRLVRRQKSTAADPRKNKTRGGATPKPKTRQVAGKRR